ncbi:TPA: hypothetical protein EYP66_18295 [Candidatus Poribacteria bacterium]|nr:hypothetical protein [Candidatus Poribacteria bacterium]
MFITIQRRIISTLKNVAASLRLASVVASLRPTIVRNHQDGTESVHYVVVVDAFHPCHAKNTIYHGFWMY